MLEFGCAGILDFPVQTAVKTGTSSDYLDSWAVGFNDKYTVGVWMGNLDYEPTVEITGARGPALVLRAVFNELNKQRETKPLFFSRTLKPKKICALSGKPASSSCPRTIIEWYKKDNTPQKVCNWHKKKNGLIYVKLPSIYNSTVKSF